MAFSLDGVENAAAELPKANYPQIRLFTVPRKIALRAQSDTASAHWEICTPESAKSFSAVAYFFAREIQRRLGEPVGVVESVWPGTTIQTWISPEFLRADSDLRNVFESWNRATPAEKSVAEGPQPFDLQFDDFELIPAASSATGKTLANFDDGNSRLATGGTFSYTWTDAANSMFNLLSPGHGGDGFGALISGKLDGSQDAILTANYKFDGSPIDLSSYDGIRFWVRGNGSFRFRSKQPTITDYDDYANPLIKATPDWQLISILFRDLKQDGWGVVRDFTQASISGFSIEILTSAGYAPMPVSGLYEGMITPLLPFAFRGALWYQGESNALQAQQYKKLLPALIANWRQAFHDENLEFLIVQLPNHGAIPTEPGESAWAELREAQLRTVMQVPHTGLAVTIDVGDPDDLHPHRKLEVGERLARWALGTIYKEQVEPSGPLFESAKIEGSQIRLRFSHVGRGLAAGGGGDLVGFAVAGADRKFHWAQARIEGDTITVANKDVPSPVAVRYAWGDSPPCNLVNSDNVPASPFRTDNWPGITASR
jgi:sialate O-acetylesterase